MDYGEVVQESFRIGPQRLKRFSNLSRYVVYESVNSALRSPN